MNPSPHVIWRNPFSTCFTKPGAVRFVFPAGKSLESLLTDWEQAGFVGQIVGPHGSGKSTLLHDLADCLSQHGVQVEYLVIQTAQTRQVPAEYWQSSVATPGDEALSPRRFIPRQLPRRVYCIDGWEQLHPLRKLAWRCTARLQAAGLIVSAHTDQGLPCLWQTESRLETLLTLAEHLAPGWTRDFTRQELVDLLQRHQGNLRELFFAWYDIAQQRGPAALAG